MRPVVFKLFLLTVCLTFALGAIGQVCTGSLGDPVVNETFGAGLSFGATGDPLQLPATTQLIYTNSPCEEDGGYYGLASSIRGCHAGTWHVIDQDHTLDKYGYFMLINGPDAGGVVYQLRVPGSKLCPNTTYEFAAYVMNVLKKTDSTLNWVVPNLAFTIESANGQVLKTDTIGDLAETAAPKWVQCGTFFTSPSDGSDVILKLYDFQTAPGNGNDFAVDDITFRPCGPIVSAGFNTIGDTNPRQLCTGGNATYQFAGTEEGYDNPVYQWQQNLNDGNGWADIPGAASNVLSRTLTAAAVGTYEYRMGVLSPGAASAACRIYSDPLTVNVYPFPVLQTLPVTSVCVGQPLQLSVNQGETYQWAGPNGFSSLQQTPVVTSAANLADSGVYSVTVSTHGCPAFASTTVRVYPQITGAISNDVTICQGGLTTLSAAQSTGAISYTWTPATGLDGTGVATVNASPPQTTTYTVTIRNNCDSVTRNVTVTVLKKPVADAGPNKKMMEGGAVKLNGAVAGDSISYYWTPPSYLDNANSLTPVANPPDNITYTLHVQTSDNCGADSSYVFVRVYKKITIPNTFSPNNDGINDYWDIKELFTYPECTVSVFNRYGHNVFQSNGYARPWDGLFNGAPLPQGTYYYIIDLKNDTPKIGGWVLVVR